MSGHDHDHDHDHDHPPAPAPVVDGLGQSGNQTSRRRRRLSLDGQDADAYDDSLSHIFAENAAWANSMKASDPDYFKNLARLPQKPDILWISCCDSRVPVELLINARPGQYAVQHLAVKQIVVCGHGGCGGVAASLNQQNWNSLMVNKWLMSIKDCYKEHSEAVDMFAATQEERVNRLVSFNVIQQVWNLAHTSIVQHAWKSGTGLQVHGLEYTMGEGTLRRLITLDATALAKIDPIYQYQS